MYKLNKIPTKRKMVSCSSDDKNKKEEFQFNPNHLEFFLQPQSKIFKLNLPLPSYRND